MADKLEVRILGPEDYPVWDEFVTCSDQGTVFCYSWWISVTAPAGIRLIALFENGSIEAGIPAPLDRQNHVNEPFLTRTLGVLFRKRDYKSERERINTRRKQINELLKHLPQDQFVQMSMHHSVTDWLTFKWHGFQQTTRYTYIIEYGDHSGDDLRNSLDNLRKRMIKKAAASGIRVEISGDAELVYSYVVKSYERQGQRLKFTFNEFRTLDKVLEEKGCRLIFSAADSTDRVHAVLYAVFDSGSAYYLMSGSDPELRELGGHTLILWEAVKYFAGKTQFFNFCGSDTERIETHIRGFGGTLTPYSLIYNEQLVEKSYGIRHHLARTAYHIKEIARILAAKVLGGRTGK